MADIVLKDRDGNPVNYPTDTVSLLMSDGTVQKFVNIAGVPIPEERTVDLNFASGGDVADMEITPSSEGRVMSKVTVKKPETLIPENIAKDVDIGGVVGTHEGGGTDYSDLFNKTLSTATGLTAMTIPSSAFISCFNLQSVSFPVCERVCNQAFRYCSSLESVSFPACKSIDGYAFNCCSNLKTISFPACTTLNGYTFLSCYNLQEASFPVCANVSVQDFAYCSALKSVSFPACTSISLQGFISCVSLESAFFPVCATVSSYAFAYCYSLNTVSFPACTTIGSSAFFRCSKLMSVYLLGSSYVTLISSGAFISTPMQWASYTGSYGSFFVPESMLASYKTRAQWSFFSNRFVGLTDDEIAALEV